MSPIIITSNDLAAAWASDRSGNPLYPLIPGGHRQREMALRAGVNLVMYTLTGNYKADQVHVRDLLGKAGALMRDFSLNFAPLLPVWLLIALAVAGAVVIALGLLARRRGTLLRALGLALVLAALVDPSLVREDRQPLRDVVAVVLDRSASQTIGDRARPRPTRRGPRSRSGLARSTMWKRGSSMAAESIPAMTARACSHP